MKGFQEIEFIISVFVFITTISFVTIVIINNIPLFYSIALAENLKSKSYQLSEIVLFNEGDPKNWETLDLSGTNRIGLSSGRNYFVQEQKLQKLREFCSSANGYETVKNKLGIPQERDIIIEATYIDGSPVTNEIEICKPPVITRIRQQFQATRFGVLNTFDGQIVRLRFTVIN